MTQPTVSKHWPLKCSYKRYGGIVVSGPSLPVPVELVSGDVFIVAPECVDAPEC